MKTRAAVAFAANRDLEVCEVDLEAPRSGEVMVRLVATGVCHTDITTFKGLDPEGKFPCILGHEGAGIVCEVGEGVTSVNVGDHVIPLYIPECQKCSFCLSGKTNLCQSIRETQGLGVMPDGSSRFSYKGKKIHHYMGTSTFSEYTVLPEVSVAKVSKQAPLEKICLLGCAITTGIGAVQNTAKVTEGSTVAVFGLGGIGLSVIQGAVMAKAKKIIGIDINPEKFELAKKFGATDIIDGSNGQAKEEIIELTNGGVDYSFECVGNVNLMREALECCHKGWGECTIVGVAEGQSEISTRPFQLITGRVWKGTAFGGVKGRSELSTYVDNYLNGQIKIDEYITRTLPLDKINEAMISKNGLRTVVTF